jgi:hypothetical protein
MTDVAVLPLQTFLFQFLFLLVAIALEARVLYRKMRLSRRASVEYATFINLLAASIGWLVFFIAHKWIPLPLKDQLVSYIFFDRLLGPNPENLTLVIVATGVVIFFSAFLIKLKGLDLLEAFVEDQPNDQDPSQATKRPWPTLTHRLDEAVAPPTPNHTTTILLANAYSYSAISLLLFLRFVQIHALR